jgi:hypothetical protein
MFEGHFNIFQSILPVDSESGIQRRLVEQERCRYNVKDPSTKLKVSLDNNCLNRSAAQTVYRTYKTIDDLVGFVGQPERH